MGSLAANARAHGRPCVSMRTHTAFKLLVHVHATMQGAYSAAGAAQSQPEGGLQMKRVHATHRARTLLTGQLAADVRVRGMPCECMLAHPAPAWLVCVHATS